MQIILFEPEIPPNTGTIARLCAATCTVLNLVEPLGFRIDDRAVRRAGLDYWPHVPLRVWPSWEALVAGWDGGRLVCSSARRGEPYHQFCFQPDDGIVLGPETRGLPPWIVEGRPAVRIPIWGKVRSLNIANAASVLLYEALRQTGALDAHV
jgi:tRNA (cytidine/uridine-2'-O-)-methyltransferase